MLIASRNLGMKYFFFLFIILPFFAWNQTIHKDNLTKKVKFYFDSKQQFLESTGSYYTDPLGESMDKHGTWLYYDKQGALIEERTYYRGKLHGKVIAKFPNGKMRQEGYFKLDQADSIYREWNEIGNLVVQGAYFNNLPVGNWEYFYIDGRPKMIQNYDDSIVKIQQFWLSDQKHTQTIIDGNGELLDFYNTGEDKEWYNYKNGLKHGRFEEYSIRGYVLISGRFEAGIKDSTWNYYYYTGQIEKTSNYAEGKLNGAYKYYYDNGQLNVEGEYSDGKKDGIWTWYTNKGTIDQQGKFKQDLMDGEWIYNFPTGELSYRAQYKNNLKDGEWTYYEKDGTVFKKGNYTNDLKNGKWETWYEDGTLLMSGMYKAGLEDGVWVNYWENGKEKNIATFKKGKLEGKWVSYFPSGKLKLSGEYKNGYKTGEWTDYFENGKPKDIGNYKVVKIKSKVEYGPMKDFESFESVKDGKWQSFSQKDYKLIEEGEYKDGEKHGTWYAYWPGGKIPSVVSNYKNGKLEGKMIEYDRRGNIVSETEYKDGLKHGKMKIFDKKGKVIKEMDFEFGQQVIKTNGKDIQFKP